jgi:hypothetical protein
MHDAMQNMVNMIIARLLNQQSIRRDAISMMPSIMDILWSVHHEVFTVEMHFGRPYSIPKLPGVYEKRKEEMGDTPIVPFSPL